jgi:hypothetical protein
MGLDVYARSSMHNRVKKNLLAFFNDITASPNPFAARLGTKHQKKCGCPGTGTWHAALEKQNNDVEVQNAQDYYKIEFNMKSAHVIPKRVKKESKSYLSSIWKVFKNVWNTSTNST